MYSNNQQDLQNILRVDPGNDWGRDFNPNWTKAHPFLAKMISS